MHPQKYNNNIERKIFSYHLNYTLDSLDPKVAQATLFTKFYVSKIVLKKQLQRLDKIFYLKNHFANEV